MAAKFGVFMTQENIIKTRTDVKALPRMRVSRTAFVLQYGGRIIETQQCAQTFSRLVWEC